MYHQQSEQEHLILHLLFNLIGMVYFPPCNEWNLIEFDY